ncbi:MAG: YbaB/EbfC family nucleoid-associated protein [Candidatus Delongbacteria bacterium]
MKGGLGGLIKQAQVMKLKLDQLKERLAGEDYSASAGEEGCSVHVTVSGRQQVRRLQVDPAAAADPALLEDLLLTALNRALDESRAKAEREMSALTGGVQFPGL